MAKTGHNYYNGRLIIMCRSANILLVLLCREEDVVILMSRRGEKEEPCANESTLFDLLGPDTFHNELHQRSTKIKLK